MLERRSPTSAAPVSILLLAVWFGLVTGLLEIAVLAFRKFILNDMIFRSPHFVWLAPAFYCGLFVIMMVPFVLAAGRWPERAHDLAVFSGTFIAAASTLILLAYGRLHNLALLILAIGAAVQMVRMTRAHSSGLDRIVRYSTPAMAITVVIAGVAVGGWRVGREAWRAAGLPAARAGAPNVLLIILDTVRAANLGLYGYARATTPELERFARRGVIFHKAISPSPWTLPSHASMFTGRPAHELSADWLVPFDQSTPTLADAFRLNGYETGGFVANLIFGTWETGLNRGFLRYEDYPLSIGQLVMNAELGRFIAGRWSLRELIGSDQVLGRKDAAHINRDFLSWVGESRDRPFFAFLNYYDAHDPYLPPAEYYRAMSGHERENQLSPLRRVPIPERRAGLSPEAIRVELDSYDGALAYLDHQLGLLFAELERRSLLDNTIVIVTADHGEEFGEHGLWYHGNSLYINALHVPLIIAMPNRVPAGYSVPDPVSLTDLPATISELAELPQRATFPGVSLSRTWQSSPVTPGPAVSSVRKGVRLPEWYPISSHDLVSVVDDHRHYIRQGQTKEELYDLASDPTELRNLAGDPQAGAWLPALRAAAPASAVRSK